MFKHSTRFTAMIVLAIATSFNFSSVQAKPVAIGTVERAQESVIATQAGKARVLGQADLVLWKDQLRTGPGGRLEAKLDDDSTLTLGENGRITIDEFVYKPGYYGGTLSINAIKGAFVFTGGKIEGPSGGNVAIHTPVGTIGVRGTTVWGGPLDGGYGVLVLSGEVAVETKKGMVTIPEGKGIVFFPGDVLKEAKGWPEDRTQRALLQTNFTSEN